MSDIKGYLTDLAAFADDDEEVLVESDGSFALVRGGDVIGGRFVFDADNNVAVEVNDQRVPYRRFLTHNVARLDVLAERLLLKRHNEPQFVDGPSRLYATGVEPRDATGLASLRGQCTDPSPFATRIVFVTADAGHGKTVLLKQLQHEQAVAFREGRSDFLVWHVDLQGRQLLRLSEALMGDLADLRVPGLWMPAVLRLMRQRAIVLAIDGFDELAAEQGSADALGALTMLVRDLEGRGVVIAASRRTFFDTEDYLARAGLLRRTINSPSEFNQLSLLPWTAREGIAYLTYAEVDGRRVDNPMELYDSILEELGGEPNHPMVSRPFLFSRVVRGLLLYNLTPSDFVRGMDDPMRGVAAVVDAFVKREVSDKWKTADTGEPYLTFNQHLELLAAVAEEMYRSQRDRLSVDIIETLTTILLDEWDIDVQRRQQVIQMVRMHVLLVVPPDGDGASRAFDHSEFRDYFVAVSLRDRIRELREEAPSHDLSRLFSIAQLSDSTARYVCGMLEFSAIDAAMAAQNLAEMVRDEWKPTYLQTNVGTLIPFILSGHNFTHEVTVDGGIVISSLVPVGSYLRNVTFRGSTFVRASTERVDWQDVTFDQCDLGELTIDLDARYERIMLRDSTIESIRVVRDGSEVSREYAPPRMRAALERAGFVFGETYSQPELVEVEESEVVRVMRRFLRLFHRTTVVSSSWIDSRFRQDRSVVYEQVIPLMMTYGLLEEREWRGAGVQRVWALKCLLDELLSAEGSVRGGDLARFWVAAHNL